MKHVRDVMRKVVITAGPAITLEEAARIMTKNKVGSVVIVEHQKPTGIVTSEDIVSAVANGLATKKITVNDIPKKGCITVSPDEGILSTTKLMMKTGVKRIPVVEKGRLVGIISEKEIMLTTPEMIDILSEKLKARVERVAAPDTKTSGVCEGCEGYSDELLNVDGEWLCEDCREK